MNRKHTTSVLLALLVLAMFGGDARAQRANPTGHWVSAWTTSLMPTTPLPGFPPEPPITDKTIRMLVRPSIGGQRLRVRLSNEFGTSPLTIAAARIALTEQGSKIRPATDHVLTFGGNPKITIPAGAPVFSDPVDIAVTAFSELSISLYLPGTTAASSSHVAALQDTYFAPGDLTAKAELPNAEIKPAWYFLSGIDVWAPQGTTTTVAFGDSITQGSDKKTGTYIDYPDQLAKRLAAQGGQAIAVVNQGIGGNRILHDVAGPSALSRFDRDVLSLPGVTNLIMLIGINDIGFPRIRMSELKIPNLKLKESPFASQRVSAEEMIVGLRQLIARARAHGIKVIGATLTPFEGTNSYDADGEAVRQAVNKWVRSTDEFDAIIDFDAIIRDPEHPTKMLEAYDSGDRIHPNGAGYKAMADAVPLDLLTSH